MDENCIFCKIIKNEIPSYKIYEDNNFVAFFDKFPTSFGHTLIIPKKHFKNIYEIDEKYLSEILVLAKKISIILKEILNATGINILQNNEKDAGQTVEHFHLHIIPRYKNDTEIIKFDSKEITDDKINNILKIVKNKFL